MKRYLAIDIGASSGRHIVGWRENGEIRTQEVYRFPNGFLERDGHLVWDVEALVSHVKAGVDAAIAAFGAIESLSIDTWGVDYVLMRDERELLPFYGYRDSRTEAVIPRVHEIVPPAELYRRTGIQFQSFNTIYQLFADLRTGRLADATEFLMTPEYLLYRLCGVKAHEYTIATTTGLVDAAAGEYDPEIIDVLGLPRRLFKPLQRPGELLGEYRGIRVVLCATHDTASAVEGIPMEGDAPFLSSGTWSLLGVKADKPITSDASRISNWSNEGGVGYIRYLKNMPGMWLVNCLRDELCPGEAWSTINAWAEASDFDGIVDVNDPALMAPKSMKALFDAMLDGGPRAAGDYFRSALRSLALAYRQAIEELQNNTGRRYDRLYIVGGGAKNGLLNRMTEQASGKKVVALPIEATAIGNLKVQLRRTES